MEVLLNYDFYEFLFIIDIFELIWPHINLTIGLIFNSNNLTLVYIGILTWFINFIDSE